MNNKDSLELTIQKLNILSSSNVISYTYKQVIDRAIDLLIEQREIVHCNDCKYCSSEIRDGIQFAKCELKHNWMPQAEWFCADGERKEGR